MKVPTKKLEVALRRRRQEAREKEAPVKEPSRRVPDKEPIGKVNPSLIGVGAEEGGQPAPPVNAGEENPAAAEPIVVELDPEMEIPATTEPTEAGQVENEDGPSAPPEPKMERAPPSVEEGEAATTATGAEVETTCKDKAGLGDSSMPVIRSSIRRAIGKVPRRPRRPAPRLSSMEDAGQAEHLLGKL